MSIHNPDENRSSVVDQSDGDQQEPVAALVMSQGTVEIRGGPLPEPSVLSEYDQVLPGLADRIVNMAESEATHRQRMQSRLLELSSRRSFAGLIAGFIIALSSLAVAVWIINNGHYIAGTVLVSCDIVALTTIFVLGTKQGE